MGSSDGNMPNGGQRGPGQKKMFVRDNMQDGPSSQEGSGQGGHPDNFQEMKDSNIMDHSVTVNINDFSHTQSRIQTPGANDQSGITPNDYHGMSPMRDDGDILGGIDLGIGAEEDSGEEGGEKQIGQGRTVGPDGIAIEIESDSDQRNDQNGPLQLGSQNSAKKPQSLKKLEGTPGSPGGPDSNKGVSFARGTKGGQVSAESLQSLRKSQTLRISGQLKRRKQRKFGEELKIRNVMKWVSLLCNDSKSNPKWMRWMLFSLFFLNSALFLNLFIYLKYSQNWSGIFLWLVALPWLTTAAMQGCLGIVFERLKAQIKKQGNSKTSQKAAFGRAMLFYMVYVVVNVICHVYIVHWEGRITGELMKDNVQFTQERWAMKWLEIFVVDSVFDACLCGLIYMVNVLGCKKFKRKIMSSLVVFGYIKESDE